MSRTRRSSTTEYKVEAAHRVIDTACTIAEVAVELSLDEALLGRWVRDERRRVDATTAHHHEPLGATERTELVRHHPDHPHGQTAFGVEGRLLQTQERQ